MFVTGAGKVTTTVIISWKPPVLSREAVILCQPLRNLAQRRGGDDRRITGSRIRSLRQRALKAVSSAGTWPRSPQTMSGARPGRPVVKMLMASPVDSYMFALAPVIGRQHSMTDAEAAGL
jgi:hypothetical protein